MVLKILLLLVVLAIVYMFFFRKKRVDSDEFHQKKRDESQEMVECKVCSTYTPKKDSIYANMNWYCSKECLRKS